LQLNVEALFAPFTLNKVTLRNRTVMAPMTRNFSPRGVPGAGVAAYYRRRAEGGGSRSAPELVRPRFLCFLRATFL
jgi:2,4-dienoyl-CoA reductase-like NADH-dependent reductase (Old Yellow Enzyme family)